MRSLYFLLVVFSLLFLVSCVPPPGEGNFAGQAGATVIYHSCYDTDGNGTASRNLFQAGKVFVNMTSGGLFKNISTLDRCSSNVTLREQFCIDANRSATLIVNCTAGCRDGACLPVVSCAPNTTWVGTCLGTNHVPTYTWYNSSIGSCKTSLNYSAQVSCLEGCSASGCCQKIPVTGSQNGTFCVASDLYYNTTCGPRFKASCSPGLCDSILGVCLDPVNLTNTTSTNATACSTGPTGMGRCATNFTFVPFYSNFNVSSNSCVVYQNASAQVWCSYGCSTSGCCQGVPVVGSANGSTYCFNTTHIYTNTSCGARELGRCSITPSSREFCYRGTCLREGNFTVANTTNQTTSCTPLPAAGSSGGSNFCKSINYDCTRLNQSNPYYSYNSSYCPFQDGPSFSEVYRNTTCGPKFVTGCVPRTEKCEFGVCVSNITVCSFISGAPAVCSSTGREVIKNTTCGSFNLLSNCSSIGSAIGFCEFGSCRAYNLTTDGLACQS